MRTFIAVIIVACACGPDVRSARTDDGQTPFQRLHFQAKVNISDEAVVERSRKSSRALSVVDPKDRYPAQVEKRDAFFVGNRVVINEPVYTYGGDVLIFADEVEINAVVDTRPRVRLKVPFWDMPYRYYRTPIYSEDRAAMHHLLNPRSVHKYVAQAFFDWVLWHDDFDMACRCFRFRSVPLSVYDHRRHQSDHTTRELISEVVIPIMPFGIMRDGQPYVPGSDGTDAPISYDRSTLRSGTIRIFARKMSTCDSCKREAFVEPQVQGGDPFDTERKRLLMAGGLKGGRGGPGGVAHCVPYFAGPGNFRSACDRTWNTKGGLSGEPTAGADGGNIEIHFIDNPAAVDREIAASEYLRRCETTGGCAKVPEQFSGALAALSDVTGGAPSQTKILQTPSFNILRRNAKEKGRTVLEPVRDVRKPQAELFGTPGAFSVRNTRIELALSQVISLLAAADASGKYDRVAQLACVAENRRLVTSNEAQANDSDFCPDVSTGVASPIIRDMLAHYMESILLERQRIAIGNVRGYLIERDGGDEGLKDIFATHDCSESSKSGMNAVEVSLLNAICDFRAMDGRTAAESYFVRSGGVYRVVENRAVPDLTAERLLAANRQAAQYLLSIANDLKKNRLLVHQRIAELRIAEYESALQKLVKALERIGEQTRDDREAFGLDVDKIQSAINSSKAAYKSYMAGDYFSAGVNGYNAARDAFEFLETLSDDGNATAFARHELREKYKGQIHELTLELQAFMRSAETYQHRITLENNQLVSRYLMEERDIVAAIRNVRLDYSNFIKASIIAYSLNAFERDNALDANLRALDDLISNFPRQQLALQPAVRMSPCGEGEFIPWVSIEPADHVGCVLMEARGTRYAVLPSNDAGVLRKLPLAVLDASDQSRAFPFSMFGVYRKEQLKLENIP